MPTFELSTPDGKSYEIDAADIGMAQKAFDHAFGGGADPATTPAGGETQGPADPRSWLQRQASDAGQAVHDISRLTANGAMFGYGDKLAGFLRGTGTEQERTLTRESADRAGWAGELAGVAGSIGALPAGGLGLLSRVPSTLTGAAGLGARTLAAGGEGAALGVLSASGHGTDIGTGAALGGAFGAGGNLAGEAIARGIGGAAGAFNKPVAVPEASEIKAAAQQAYKRSEAAGVIIKPEWTQRVSNEIRSDLADLGYHPALAPKVGVVLSHLDELGQGNVTLKGVDTLRKMAGAARSDADPFTKYIGEQVTKKIDKHLDDLNLNDVLTGNKTEGVRALQEARGLWATSRKSEMVDQALEKAALQAGSAGSGGNIDNAIRQQFKAILNNPKKSRGLTEDERAAMREIVVGNATQNALRLAGKLAPNGNGLMLTIQAAGGAATGGATLPLAIAGSAAKSIADKSTSNNVYALARLIRSGGDASKMRPVQNAVQRLSEAERATLGRILTSWGVTSAPGIVSP
jgi:hypothetical protein